MIRLFIALCALVLVADSADACSRCGLFGNRCRYYTYQYQYPVQHVAAVVQQPDVFVVQNNYPQPIAQQGQTLYGYQAAAAQYFVNPAEVLRQSAELSKAASITAQIGLNGYNDTARTQLALQAQITEPLVKSVAATQVLTAAGLNVSSQQEQQSLALRIYSEGGQWKVEQANSDEISARVEASVGGGVQASNGPPPEPRPANSILAQKCARCHGLDKAEPKGGVFLDAGHKIDCNLFAKSLKLVRVDKMPPDGALSPQEKAALMDELMQLSDTE